MPDWIDLADCLRPPLRHAECTSLRYLFAVPTERRRGNHADDIDYANEGPRLAAFAHRTISEWNQWKIRPQMPPTSPIQTPVPSERAAVQKNTQVRRPGPTCDFAVDRCGARGDCHACSRFRAIETRKSCSGSLHPFGADVARDSPSGQSECTCEIFDRVAPNCSVLRNHCATSPPQG
jgi:hypothetical protein